MLSPLGKGIRWFRLPFESEHEIKKREGESGIPSNPVARRASRISVNMWKTGVLDTHGVDEGKGPSGGLIVRGLSYRANLNGKGPEPNYGDGGKFKGGGRNGEDRV